MRSISHEGAHPIIIGGTDDFFRGSFTIEFRHVDPINIPTVRRNNLNACKRALCQQQNKEKRG